MGKQGPCCHCGTASTPLWRNGPLDKPVLCNACGSRWRRKGTLENYMPMHSGTCGAKSEAKASRVKKPSQKLREQNSHKRKEPCDGHLVDCRSESPDFCAVSKTFEDDVSTRSSVASGVSYSESCIRRIDGHFPVCKPFWGFPHASKRRCPMHRGRASTAKLVARLKPIFPDPVNVVDDEDSDEDLLVEYKPPLMEAEIGLGGIFIKPCLSHERESDASSIVYEANAKGYSYYSESHTPKSSTADSSFGWFVGGTSQTLSLQGNNSSSSRESQKIAGHLENDTFPVDTAALEQFEASM